jgi:2-keto-4-pentenoate hydratase
VNANEESMSMLDVPEIAARLRGAYANGPVLPLRDALAPNDIDGAYAVQSFNTEFWVNEGRRIAGRKIGLTAKAVQQQLGVDQPDFGVLFADMQIQDGGSLVTTQVIQPKAEAEVALIMGADVNDPDITGVKLAAAVEYAVAAIEIVDSRIAEWKITFADTVADNGSSAFYVLGSRRLPLEGLDLYTCGMVLEFNGEVRSLGAGAACLGHPLNAALWLARTLAARGEGLRKGDLVLTGALGPMVALTPGDKVHARIGGLGAVSFTYLETQA